MASDKLISFSELHLGVQQFFLLQYQVKLRVKWERVSSVYSVLLWCLCASLSDFTQ